MNSPLTATERYERENAVRQSHANVRLSGFPENPELDALCKRYIAGEIDLDGLLTLNGMAPSEKLATPSELQQQLRAQNPDQWNGRRNPT